MGQQYAFKHAHVIRHVCMLLFLLPFIMGCEEDKEPSVYSPTLTTNSVTGLSRFGATFQGTVMKHPGSTGELKIGFLYSTSASLSNAQEVNATPGRRQQLYCHSPRTEARRKVLLLHLCS